MNKLYWILPLVFCLRLHAQVPVVRLHTTQDLATVRFTSIFQDKQGWVWLGAENALYRYDGQELMPVRLPAKLELSSVSALFENKDRLWVGFQNGMIAFLDNSSSKIPIPTGDFEQDLLRAPELTLWEPEEGLPKVPITGFAVDQQAAFWISTYGEGLYVWKEERLFQYNHLDDGLSSDDIYAMTTDLRGSIWVATDGGISICSMPKKGIKKVKTLSKSDGLPDEIITYISTDNHGNIWGGTDEKGVFRYNSTKKQFDFFSTNWSYGAINSLQVFGEDEIWIGTEKFGIVWLEIKTGNTVQMPPEHPLAAAKIGALFKDREGLLWIIANQGLLYSSNVRFSMLQTPFPNIQAICSDPQERFWIGTQEGLFLRKGNHYAQILPKTENIMSLWGSPRDGTIWAGTLGNGVFLIHPESHKVRHLPERETHANGSVLSITGNSERVWLATLDGVSVLNAKTLQLENDMRSQELGANYVYKVYTDSKGRVWFGTDGDGLVLFENGHFRSYSEANDIELNTIYSIVEDHHGNIWFSTARNGLFQFDGTAFKHYSMANHLHSMDITGLAVDGKNQLIISYEDGFDILNPDRFDHINFCGEKTGAPKVSVNLNALWTDAQGHVWLGTEQGILRSAAFKEITVDDPQPGITGVSVFLQPLDFTQASSFDYDQNNFLFNFVGLWYTDPESVRYRYLLEGYDPDWKVSKDHTSSYPKLPPGNYTFRIQTSEHGNFANVPEATWSFKIGLPFWKRWWFILLSGILVAGLFRSYVQSREKRLKRVDRLKRENVESQFETLKSQINPHFLFNSFNTLITIIEESPKLAVEYVEHLSDFYRNIMVYRERDFISVGEEMELVRSFHFLLKKRYEDGLLIKDRVERPEGQVMPLSLQMLVENAVKHNIISVSKPLIIEIFTQGNYIVVRNNIQRKIKPEPSTHFGLQSLLNRYKLLGERPVLVEDNEAFFVVKIPIL